MMEPRSSLAVLIRSFRLEDESEVVALWDRCGLLRPWNDPHKDIDRKRSVGADHLLVAVTDDRVVGTAMACYRGHHGWISYFAVEPALRGCGIGWQLMANAERRLLTLGCPKVNLQIRAENTEIVAFYRQLGYDVDDVVSLGKRLIDDCGVLERSNARPK